MPAIARPTEIIATARDSWSPRVPLPWGPKARGQAQALGPARAQALPRPWGAVPPDGRRPRRVSFSSQPAFSPVSPAAGPREPGWARVAAQRRRPPPPDAPTRFVADNR